MVSKDEYNSFGVTMHASDGRTDGKNFDHRLQIAFHGKTQDGKTKFLHISLNTYMTGRPVCCTTCIGHVTMTIGARLTNVVVRPIDVDIA